MNAWVTNVRQSADFQNRGISRISIFFHILAAFGFYTVVQAYTIQVVSLEQETLRTLLVIKSTLLSILFELAALNFKNGN